MGGSSLLGGLLNRPSGNDRAAQSAQTNALNSQTQLADMMRRLTQNQMDLTGPAYSQGLQYFQKALTGNRASMVANTLPERRGISEAYRGGESYINRTMTGASRQREQGELARERSGRLADLIPGQRAGAASTLLSEADPARLLSALGQTSGAYGQSANTAQGVLNSSMLTRQNSAQQGQDWAKLLSLFFPQGGKSGAGKTNFGGVNMQGISSLLSGIMGGGR